MRTSILDRELARLRLRHGLGQTDLSRLPMRKLEDILRVQYPGMADLASGTNAYRRASNHLLPRRTKASLPLIHGRLPKGSKRLSWLGLVVGIAGGYIVSWHRIDRPDSGTNEAMQNDKPKMGTVAALGVLAVSSFAAVQLLKSA